MLIHSVWINISAYQLCALFFASSSLHLYETEKLGTAKFSKDENSKFEPAILKGVRLHGQLWKAPWKEKGKQAQTGWIATPSHRICKGFCTYLLYLQIGERVKQLKQRNLMAANGI